MIEAEIPENETVRLAALHELEILDTLAERAYDDLTQLAATICQTPIALVSLIDKDRQWFKSRYGLDAASETPRALAFCAHAIHNDEPFVVNNAEQDERFYDNPLVTGGPRVIFYAGAPLIMSDCTRLGTLCVVDHHPRVLNMQQIQALQALARQVVSQMELRLHVRRAEKLERAKDEFITAVSHELRTPLTSLYGALSLLAHGQLGALHGSALSTVENGFRNAKRLLNLVNEVLDVTKLESGLLDFRHEDVDLFELIKKSAELNQPYCEAHHVQLKIQADCEDHIVQADEQRLLQVLDNFISNAAKYTYENDTIEISLHADPDALVVSVCDHGPGISAYQQEHLFKKFKQLPNHPRRSIGGSGLGLYLSKQIIQRQGGQIGCESHADENTCFYFRLPRAA